MPEDVKDWLTGALHSKSLWAEGIGGITAIFILLEPEILSKLSPIYAVYAVAIFKIFKAYLRAVTVESLKDKGARVRESKAPTKAPYKQEPMSDYQPDDKDLEVF